MKPRKLLAVVCSICLIASLIPVTAFAEEEPLWTGAYKNVEVGDVVWQHEKIASLYSEEEIPITLESVIYEDAEHTTLFDAYEDTKKSITVDYEEDGTLYAPTDVVIDEVKVNETKEAIIISYICTAIECTSPTTQMKGEVCYVDEPVELIYTGDQGTSLEVRVKYYEDKNHEILSETYPSETFRLEAGDEGSFAVPETMSLDSVKYSDDDSDCAVLEYVFSVKRYEIHGDVSMAYYSGHNIRVSNLMEKDLTVASKLYKDKELTQMIDDDGDGYTNSFVVAPGAMKKCTLIEYGDENYWLTEIQDYSHDKENPRLIYVYYEASNNISEEGKDALSDLRQLIEEKIQPFENMSYNIQIADPDAMGIDSWTERTALEFASSSRGMQLYFGVEEVNIVNGCWLLLNQNYYDDKAMTKPVNVKDLEAGETYYLHLSYSGGSEIEGVPVNYKFEMKNPCEITFEFVDVDGHEAEIEKIKDNLTKDLGEVVATYDDLAWVNLLVTSGERLTMLPAAKNCSSMIKERCPEVFEQLVGDTLLDLSVSYGSSGDAGRYDSRVNGEINFYVDDVLYYGRYQGCTIKVDLTSMLYVPEGTVDYAAHVEDRVNAYLGDSGCSVDVEKLSPQALTEILLVDSDFAVPEGTEATYFTEHGFVFYSHPSETKEEYFIGSNGGMSSIFFERLGLEAEGSVDYIYDKYAGEFEDLAVYPVYGISINDDSRDEVKSYLSFVKTGTEDQMKEPYAEWMDQETDIITQGLNGQIPLDAFTKIHVIKNGEEIELIQKKEGNNKNVYAYNINAFTNFKDGQLEDLGGGRMKVMIPLGELNRDTVKAHYVDSEGNVHDLDITVETHDGKEYVCFITNHFSVYALSGDTTDQNTQIIVEEEDTVIADQNKEPVPQEESKDEAETPDTGDHNDLATWIIISLFAATAVFAFKKKRTL